MSCLTKAGALIGNSGLSKECEGFPLWMTGIVKRDGEG